MIINDFEISYSLNKNINIFILLDDSLRSFITIKLIKSFFNKKCVFETKNELNDVNYNNIILILHTIPNDFFDKELLNKIYEKKNILIFILQKYNNTNILKKVNDFLKNNVAIINFKDLNYSESLLWIEQFFNYKSVYCNTNIFLFLNKYFRNNVDIFIINSINIYYKTNFLLSFLLNINFETNNETIFLEHLYKKKYNMTLFLYRNTEEYTFLLKNYSFLKKNNNFILFFLIILDINIKNNNTEALELILFNFIIKTFFEKKLREDNFDKFNIKYITKK